MKSKTKPIIIIIVCLLGVLIAILATIYHSRANMANITQTPITALTNTKNVIISGSKQNTPNKNNQQIAIQALKQKPHMYIVYKVGCTVCQSNFPIEERVIESYDTETQSHIAYVNWDSTFGQKLRKQYKLEHAYSIIVETPHSSKAVLLPHNDDTQNKLITLINTMMIDNN